jgi:hypothetical protein
VKINRIRNFKKTCEITFTISGKEAEYLSHAIGNLGKWSRTPDLVQRLGYATHCQRGARLLTMLNDEAFWSHWENNFADRQFSPNGQMLKMWSDTDPKSGQE